MRKATHRHKKMGGGQRASGVENGEFAHCRRAPGRRQWLLVLAVAWFSASGWPAADAARGVQPAAAPLTIVPPRLVIPLGAPVGAGRPADTAAGTYGQLPMAFEANRGQSDAHVDFLARGRGYALFLGAAQAVLALSPGPPTRLDEAAVRSTAGSEVKAAPARRAGVLRMTFVGANKQARPEAVDPLPGRVSHFTGRNPSAWQTSVPTYASVGYGEVYPGVDLRYYGTHQQLEYDFVIRPGADVRAIAIDFEGAEHLTIDNAGDLVMRTAAGTIRQRKPRVYQDAHGRRHPIEGRFLLLGPSRVAFAVGAYDRTQPLVIDPVVVYSTYLGGSTGDQGWGIAVDDSGAAFVIGNTFSAAFPTSAGALDTTYAGAQDVFVAKLNPSGSAVTYAAFLGGSDFDEGHGIAVDAAGAAYVTGGTFSADFPVTAGALDPSFNGAADVFVAKIDPAGSALEYSTYVGSAGDDRGRGIAVDVAGHAYVTGITMTGSTPFPTTTGAFAINAMGAEDAFVAKVGPTGSALAYSTLLGGGNSDFGFGIALDSAGGAYVTGRTHSSDFPATAGALDTSLGGTADAFVTKVDASGSALGYSTYLGGSALDQGFRIAVDPLGAAYLAGFTLSSDFTTTPGAFDRSFGGGGGDVFVAKVNATGSALGYATFLGGGSLETAGGIAVDATGFSCVTGVTASSDFPTTVDAPDTSANGGNDVFVTKLNAAGTALTYSTYLGGAGQDESRSAAIDRAGACYATGLTASAAFPTTTAAVDSTFNDTSGGSDAFVVKIANPPQPGPVVLDQSFEPNDYLGVGVDGVGYAIGGSLSQALAQTFTVDVSGRLVRVAVKLGGFGGPTQPIVADIRRTTAGRPVENDADVLAVVTLSPSAVPQSPNPAGYVTVDLSATPIAVSAGDMLAVVLWSGEQVGNYGWQGASTGSPPAAPLYPWGARFFRNTNSPTWSDLFTADLGFRTFVDTSAVPVDDTAPVLTVPAPLQVEATSALGATVSFAASATDDVDPAPSITCTPAPGSTFPIGSTLVTCTATDAAGNTSEGSFAVTVFDTMPPVLAGVPASLVLEATGPAGTVASWVSPVGSDAVDGPVPVTCMPQSGSTFGLGSTTVTCSTADTSGNTATDTFTVSVRDTVSPAVRIARPNRDAVITTSPATVTVDAADLVGVTSVSVNGVVAVLATGSAQMGTWSAVVPVSVPGVTLTFTAMIVDASGNAVGAAVIVDNDGIASAIDRSRSGLIDQSSVYSSEFNDGTTAGAISRSAGLIVTADKPVGSNAVRLAALGSTTATARVYVCGGSTKYVTLNGGETADVTCSTSGTVTVKAVVASPSIEVWKQASGVYYQRYTYCRYYSYRCGVTSTCSYTSCSTTTYPVYYTYWYSVSLRGAQAISTGSPVTAATDNTTPVSVTLMRVQEDETGIPVGSFDLDPGESADTHIVQGTDGGDDQIEIAALIGNVTVTIGGTTRTVSQGETSAFATDLTPPVIGPVADLTIDTTASTGAIVDYALPWATDNSDPSPRVKGEPAPGTLFPIGETPVSVTAVDAAGNGSTVGFTVKVQLVSSPAFAFQGFFHPIENLPILNRMKAGSAVPVKFSLTGYFGTNIFPAGYPVSQSISCQGGMIDDVEQTVAAGSSSLAYDAVTDQYTYVWKTDKSWAGTCRQLLVRFTDGTTKTASFSMTK